MQIIQFLLFSIFGLLIVFFLASGAIGFLFYLLSSSTEIPPLAIPNWQELPKISKEVLIAGTAIIAAVWVLVGHGYSEKEDGKSRSKKGRRRNNRDED